MLKSLNINRDTLIKLYKYSVHFYEIKSQQFKYLNGDLNKM